MFAWSQWCGSSCFMRQNFSLNLRGSRTVVMESILWDALNCIKCQELCLIWAAAACSHTWRHTHSTHTDTPSFEMTTSGLFPTVWWIGSFILWRIWTFIFGSAPQKGIATRDNTASPNPPSSKSPVWFQPWRTIRWSSGRTWRDIETREMGI